MNEHTERGGAPGAPARHAGNLPLEGGRLCLDFVNTVDWRGRARPVEWLHGYGDLLAWAVQAGALAETSLPELRRRAAARPEAARTVLERALALREALHGLFRAGGADRAATEADGGVLNAELAQGAAGWRLRPAAGGWRWEAAAGLEGLLRPIAWSAAELLASAEAGRVKACGDPACGWLFLDTSRNASRRWCSMAACGNRAKARRHYRRRSGGGLGPA